MAGDLYGDYSRISFDPTRGVSSLLSQQGRVVLDADVNEQTAVLLTYLRTLAVDGIGRYGGPDPDPANAKNDHGPFLVEPGTTTNGEPDLTIAPGRYYVAGLQCNLAADDASEPPSYYRQPHAYFEPDTDPLPAAPYLVYLRVWERLVTGIEDPNLREIALGINGPDTVTRQVVTFQVLASQWLPWDPAEPLGDVADVADFLESWRHAPENGTRPRLKARSRQPAATDEEPCVTPPNARYRGAENQLYRVEIHKGGPLAEATFKWSRNNASDIFPLERLAGDTASVTTIGRDRWSGLDVGDWVEVVDDRSAVRVPDADGVWLPEALVRIKDIDAIDRRVTLSAAPVLSGDFNLERHPFLRRWDQQTGPRKDHPGRPTATAPEQGLDVSSAGDSGWLELEDGVQIQFQGAVNDVEPVYRSGDYWLIPARTATGDVEWPGPFDDPQALAPYGIDYYFAPLAIVRDGSIDDLRSLFAPAATWVGA